MIKSRLDEIELNKENEKMYLDPRVPVLVKYAIVVAWPLLILQWYWWFFRGGNIPFSTWFLAFYVFSTVLVSGLTFLHFRYIRSGYSFTRKIAGKDFQKTLPQKGMRG